MHLLSPGHHSSTVLVYTLYIISELTWGDNSLWVRRIKGSHVSNSEPIARVDIWQPHRALEILHVCMCMTCHQSITKLKQVFTCPRGHVLDQCTCKLYMYMYNYHECIQSFNQCTQCMYNMHMVLQQLVKSFRKKLSLYNLHVHVGREPSTHLEKLATNISLIHEKF